MFVHFADAPTYCVARLRTVSTVLNFTKWMATKWTHTNASKIALNQLRNLYLSYEISWLLRNSYGFENPAPERERAVLKNARPCKYGSVKLNSHDYLCTRVLHSFLYFAHCRTASSVIPLRLSIQPNLCLLRTRPPLTSATNTLRGIQYVYWLILSSYPNHLNTFLSALPANSLSVPVHLRTSSFPTPSIHDTLTKLFKRLISRTFTFLLSTLRIPHASAPYNAVGTITPSYRHFFKFIQNHLLFSTLLGAPHALYTPHSFCVEPFQNHHPLPLANPGSSNNPFHLTVFQLVLHAFHPHFHTPITT